MKILSENYKNLDINVEKILNEDPSTITIICLFNKHINLNDLYNNISIEFDIENYNVKNSTYLKLIEELKNMNDKIYIVSIKYNNNVKGIFRKYKSKKHFNNQVSISIVYNKLKINLMFFKNSVKICGCSIINDGIYILFFLWSKYINVYNLKFNIKTVMCNKSFELPYKIKDKIQFSKYLKKLNVDIVYDNTIDTHISIKKNEKNFNINILEIDIGDSLLNTKYKLIVNNKNIETSIMIFKNNFIISSANLNLVNMGFIYILKYINNYLN